MSKGKAALTSPAIRATVGRQARFYVYALDIVLPTLPAQGPVFPPGSEALYHALIAAGRERHILATASITGFFPGGNEPTFAITLRQGVTIRRMDLATGDQHAVLR
jgi:hypothetical protein